MRNERRQILAVRDRQAMRPLVAAFALTCTVLATLVWLIAVLPAPAGAQDPADSSVGGSVLGGDDVGVVSARLFVSLARQGSVDVTTISTTATPGEDYREVTTRVDLPAAGGEFRVPLEILDDSVAESAESFFVVVSNPSPGISIGDPFGIIRIRDDDFGN